MTFEYRRHQIECADAVDDAFRAGITHPVVDMCVGSGKSIAMATTALRNWQRGERTIILSHRQELVSQDKKACDIVGVPCGINAAKLGDRVWRAPVISAMIQSVCNSAHSFGPVQNILIDECHLVPHSEAGMYRAFLRGFPGARVVGYSGTTFRLQSGSLVGPEGSLFQKKVYRYDITDGIRDGYLVPGFSAEAVDKVDESKLKKTAGEYTAASQDAQMIALMDSHVCQMKLGGADRRAWLVFEASQKAAIAMTERLNHWGIPAAVIIDKTKNREAIIEAFNSGRLRALVNVESLTTGFDSQRIDLVCFRRRTTSLGLYIQMCGRGLRTIGGNIEASIAAGKPDCLYYDFSGLIGEFGPLDFIRPKESSQRLVSCDCGKRNAAAAMRCWSCDEPMTKICPACTLSVNKGVLDCPHCQYDMRTGAAGEARAPQKLLDTPSGAALISSYKVGPERAGGWLPVRKVYSEGDAVHVMLNDGQTYAVPPKIAALAKDARWIRSEAGQLTGILVPNGLARTSIRQYGVSGDMLLVPMPSALGGEVAA